jgi:glucosamine-6-phosphate isomerase
VHVLQFDSEEAWIAAVLSLWRDRLRSNPHLRMCLPSGHTPLKIFSAMTKSVAAGQASFRHAEIFSLDEYGGLAADDPGRCANMLAHYLLNEIDLPRNRFHAIDTIAGDLDAVCRDYDKAIGTGFDLTWLGLGMNGHLGLNEPGALPDSTTRRVSLHESTIQGAAKYLTHSNLPTWGIGVGMKQLLASREIWLLVNGRAKAEIVQRTLRGPVDVAVPASLLRNHANTWLILDREAASLLDASSFV